MWVFNESLDAIDYTYMVTFSLFIAIDILAWFYLWIRIRRELTEKYIDVIKILQNVVMIVYLKNPFK